ncbi:MAG: hypothetical protein WAM11_04350 [Cyanobium sp.]
MDQVMAWCLVAPWALDLQIWQNHNPERRQKPAEPAHNGCGQNRRFFKVSCLADETLIGGSIGIGLIVGKLWDPNFLLNGALPRRPVHAQGLTLKRWRLLTLPPQTGKRLVA